MKQYWYEYGPFTVFDVETTGMSPVNDRIVELAAIRIDPDGSRSVFHSLIHPGMPIPMRVQRVHHISDTMVADAPCFAQIGNRFLTFARKSTLVAHNARFDLGFLQESLNRCGLQLWKGNTLDTLRLMRQLYPQLASHKLQSLRETFALPEPEGTVKAAHRAGADVEWTVEILRIALESLMKQENVPEL